MGGIYPKPEKSTPNSRNNNGFPNDNQPLNESNFSNVFHANTLGSTSHPSHSDFGGVFTRSLPSALPNNQTSFSIPGQRPRDKSNDDMLGYRYLAESSAFQSRNMSMSPNTILQNQFKHQNYSQANLMNTLNQNRSAAVLQQLNAVTKNESFQGPQLLQSGSKLNVDVSNRVKPTNYPINPQQHVHPSSLFQSNKRPQLLSQPPNKRSRLTSDFVNMGHHNIQQSHHLTMGQQDNSRMSSSPQKFCQKESSVYKGSLINQSKSHLLDQRSLWQNKEPAYYPQVEAISPVPEDMRYHDLKAFTEKEDIGEKLRIVDADIIKQEQNISRLQEKIELLSSKLNQPNIENLCKEEETVTPLSRDPIQSIIADNQRKATEQHQLFQKLCSTNVSWTPLALPLYRQQEDVDLLMKVKVHFHKTFKPHLIKYIRRRKLADKSRMRYLADSYEVAAKTWYKRLEKTQNSAKRRQKEGKFRELFEKTFPEIKRNREERENGEYNDGSACVGDSSTNGTSNGNNHRSLTNNFNGNTISDQQRPSSPYDAVKEMEKMKEYAIDPPLTTPSWYKDHNLIECGSLVKDPRGIHSNYQNYKPFWSRDEIDIFKEQYIITPKNFVRIASFLPKKTVSKCIHYYYLTKKSMNYKALVKKHARRRRDKAERQRFRTEADHQSHHPTSDLIIQPTHDTVEGSKIEPLLQKHLIELNSLIKEEQQTNIFGPEMDNVSMAKDSLDTKGNCVIDDNKPIAPTAGKHNKNNATSCSERNTFSKGNRGPDNDDDDDENYRSSYPSDFVRGSDNSRTLESGKTTSSENDRERNIDKNTENVYNSARSMVDFDMKPGAISNNKPDPIHIKDAIEYSIEQNLSQNLGSNINKIYTSKPYESTSQITDNNFGYPVSSSDEFVWNKINSLENSDINLKYKYFPKRVTDGSTFHDLNNESGNSDSPMRFNSSVNRAILMKDFCTAQIMNQIPISGSINPKLMSVSYPMSNTVNCIDSSRSIAPDQLPVVESYKPKISSTTDSHDPYIANISGLSKTSNSTMKKSDFFIDRVSKLYEEEVEPYTDEFRNRSDSQRTRTSSEASEMYAYIKNRSQKTVHTSKKTSVTSSLIEKNPVVDSRIKMPPPDVTDQKVFRSQKSSFSSKKNPYVKSGDNYQPTKSPIDDLSCLSATNNNDGIKRKVVTAANIIESLTDKNATSDCDVKMISVTHKSSEKSFSKIIDLSDEKFSQNKSTYQNNVQMTLDGHIKQLIVDDYDSSKRNDSNSYNFNDIGRSSMKNKNEMLRHKYNMPLKKRDKSSLVEPSSPSKSKTGYSSSSKSSSTVATSNVSDYSASITKQLLENNNNNNNNNSINYKEKLDISITDTYDSQSPQFSSPGKLLIDLDNNVDGI